MLLATEGNILTKLVCDNTDCLSYIITLLDILTILYLAYCANFKVNKAVRIVGWAWAAVVITGTVTVVAIHTCMFTLVSALFTALILMALFGVTFEDIGNKVEEEKETPPAPVFPFVCPIMAQQQCPMQSKEAVKQETVPVKEELKVVKEAAVTPADDAVEEVAAEVDEGLTLKESLALAKEVKAGADVNKKYVIDFLEKTYGAAVKCNNRGNLTKTGLPLADTHYAVGEEKNKCFVYVYETEVATVLLLRLTDEYAGSFNASHQGKSIKKSAFPKSREVGFTWYSLIADDTFTEADIQEALQAAYDLAK